MIELDRIHFDEKTQSRAVINEDIVLDYKKSMQDGQEFPPIVIFFDGTQHYLADGYHRFHAARAAGLTEIVEDIRLGTKRDAILYSVGVNAKHGLRRTNADKRKAVGILLDDEEWSSWSSREIAKACAVSNHLVDEIKDSNNGNSPIVSLSSPINNDLKSENSNNSTEKTVKFTTSTGKTSARKVNAKKELTEEEKEFAAYDPKEDELAEAHDTIQELATQIETLKDGQLVDTLPTEYRETATETFASLRENIRMLEIQLRAVTDSRNGYQRENAELKKQCQAQRREIDKLKK